METLEGIKLSGVFLFLEGAEIGKYVYLCGVNK